MTDSLQNIPTNSSAVPTSRSPPAQNIVGDSHDATNEMFYDDSDDSGASDVQCIEQFEAIHGDTPDSDSEDSAREELHGNI